MKTTFFDLYLVLGKLRDSLLVLDKYADKNRAALRVAIIGIINDLETRLALLTDDDSVIASECEIFLSPGFTNLRDTANQHLDEMVKLHPQAQHFFELRDNIAQFYLQTDTQLRLMLKHAYPQAYYAIVDTLVNKQCRVDLPVLDHLLVVADNQAALAMDVAACRQFASDIFSFDKMIVQAYQRRLFPLIEAMSLIYADNNLLKMSVITPPLQAYLSVMIDAPKLLQTYQEKLRQWWLNFDNLTQEYQPEGHHQGSGLEQIHQLLNESMQHFPLLDVRADMVRLLSLIEEAKIKINRTGVSFFGLGLLGGVSTESKMSDQRYSDDLHSHVMCMLMSNQWHGELDKLALYSPELASWSDVFSKIKVALQSVKKVYQPSLKVTENNEVVTLEKALTDSIIHFDHLNPATLGEFHTFESCQSQDDEHSSEDDSPQLLGQLAKLQLPTHVGRAMERLILNDAFNRPERLVAAQKQKELDYIRSKENLHRFYKAIRTRFQQIFVGYLAMSSGLVKGSNRGVARMASYASMLSGYSAIFFTAIAAYSRHRTYVDGTKLATLGEIGEINKTIEIFARRLTLMNEVSLRLVKDGVERGSHMANSVHGVADKFGTVHEDGYQHQRRTKLKKKKTAQSLASISSSSACTGKVSSAAEYGIRQAADMLAKAKIERFNNSALDNAAEFVVAKIISELLMVECLPEGHDELLSFCLNSILAKDKSTLDIETGLFDKCGMYTLTTRDGRRLHITELFCDNPQNMYLIQHCPVTKQVIIWGKRDTSTEQAPQVRVGTADQARAMGLMIIERINQSATSVASENKVSCAVDEATHVANEPHVGYGQFFPAAPTTPPMEPVTLTRNHSAGGVQAFSK